MKRNWMVSGVALAVATGWAAPLAAQDDDASVREELAAMRAEMARMAARIDMLEAELAQAEATADAARTAAAQAAETAAANAPAADDGTELTWKGAPLVEGKGGWSFKPRGRIQVDAGFTDVPDSTGRDDGFGNEIRRARLGVEGDIPGGFGYKFEVDFAGNSTEVSDAILTYEDGGLKIAIGHQNSFQGIEELSSSRFTSFIERAAFTDAFGFERRIGVSVQYGAGDVLLQGGLYGDNIADASNENWSADGRVVFMPKVGDAQLHLAGSVHYADYEPGMTVRYRQRPLVHFTSERFVDTGSLGADSEFGLGAEAAVIAGPFHAAAEAFRQQVGRPGALTDPAFFGGYAEVGMFLTEGDSRGYKNGTFDRVKPANPVGEGGMGAFQINARYDYLDLVDAGIVGGMQNGYYLSLIWTPTDYTRFLANYGRLEYDDAVHPAAGGDTSYSVDSFGVRAQVDF